MTSVLHEAKSDEVVRFLDIDCIPYDINVLKRVDEFCEGVKTFAGNAQNVSHLKNRNNLYAAASMLMVHKERWVQMGSPFLTWYMDGRCNQIDTAQRLTLIADEWGLPYRLLYPIGYDSQPEWILGSFGVYGRGTKYPGTWHYGRISDFAHDVPELWSKRVDDVMSGADIVPSKMSQFY